MRPADTEIVPAAMFMSVFPYFQSYLLVVHDMHLSEAGRIVQLAAFASTVSSIPISIILRYARLYKVWVVIGALLYTVCLGLMANYYDSQSTTVTIIGLQSALGIGSCFLAVPLQIGIHAAAGSLEIAAATSLTLTAVDVGSAIGMGVAGAIWTSTLPDKMALYLPPETKDQATKICQNITLASRGWIMGSTTRVAIIRAYQETMTRELVVAALLSACCVGCSLLLRNFRLEERSRQRDART